MSGAGAAGGPRCHPSLRRLNCVTLPTHSLPAALPPPQEATHFKKVRGEQGQVLYEPCSPGDPNAEPYTLAKLDEEGKAGLVRV